MQQIIVDRPYHFVPPMDSWFWRSVIQAYMPRYLDRAHGITGIECRGVEHLRQSLAAGHGILLTPNHCRPADPFVIGELARAAGRPVYIVASWHLFTKSRLQTWVLRHGGAFSIYREGMDRAAVNASIDIIEQARRPLVIFPEGLITRTNDLLGGLMEGTALIARTAAKRRAKGGGEGAAGGDVDAPPPAGAEPTPKASVKAGGGKVVVHPVAIRYFFQGDLRAAVEPVLTEIEARLTWRARAGAGAGAVPGAGGIPGAGAGMSMMDRIRQIGEALLSLKEIEFFGRPRPGAIAERQAALIDSILEPLEKEWLGGAREPHTAARVKRLRQAILPDMIKGEIAEAERERRWRQLADLYLAQQIALYPPDYVQAHAVAERFLETVERFEEDLTDKARVHRPMKVVVQVGPAIEVPAGRERGGGPDPLMKQVEEQMRQMLGDLAKEARPVEEEQAQGKT